MQTIHLPGWHHCVFSSFKIKVIIFLWSSLSLQFVNNGLGSLRAQTTSCPMQRLIHFETQFFLSYIYLHKLFWSLNILGYLQWIISSWLLWLHLFVFWCSSDNLLLFPLISTPTSSHSPHTHSPAPRPLKSFPNTAVLSLGQKPTGTHFGEALLKRDCVCCHYSHPIHHQVVPIYHLNASITHSYSFLPTTALISHLKSYNIPHSSAFPLPIMIFSNLSPQRLQLLSKAEMWLITLSY